MEKRIILGTAGHIDHGKTALVKALTGVDTDRLKEEKQRGITIELGFTSLTLPSGLRLGIVDVPGHEKFVNHMVAGATGIDLVLLVVAADEGVMPQTVEHLEICRLLGIRTGLVALTKQDLADEEMLALAIDDIQDLVRGTFLEGKPILPFSSVTGQGKEALLQAIDRCAEEAEERSTSGVARMPIDRVFTMKGFGTVVTGTLVSGRLRLGETVEILPSGYRLKIRGIQVHNEQVAEAAAGSRTAVNLQGIEKAAIRRGEILCEQDRFTPSHRVNASFLCLKSVPKPLPNRFRVMVHWGTERVLGRILSLDQRPVLEPGSTGWVQISLESPIFPVIGDRFIVRDFSTNHTLGGGVILDPRAQRFKAKTRGLLIPWLERLRSESPRDKVGYLVWKKGAGGASLQELSTYSRLAEEEVRGACSILAAEGSLVEFDPEQHAYVEADALRDLADRILEELRDFHRTSPYQSGMPKEAIRSRLAESIPEKLIAFAVDRLAEEGKILPDRDRIRIADHSVRLTDKDEALRLRILEALEQSGAMPPTVKELDEQTGCGETRLRTLLDYLAERQELVKVAEDLFYAAPVLEDLKGRLLAHLQEKGEIQAGDFKTLSGTTRKYTIPLLEYFDRIRLTLRVGDRRVLREKKA
jgi:selenocysteine-specific elongation factor